MGPFFHPASSPPRRIPAGPCGCDQHDAGTLNATNLETAHHHIPRRFLSKDPARKAIRNLIQAPTSSHHPSHLIPNSTTSQLPTSTSLPYPDISHTRDVKQRNTNLKATASQTRKAHHASTCRLTAPADHPTPHASPIAAATSRELRVLPRFHSQSWGLVEASFV